MSALEAIMKRRSVRRFTEEAVPRETAMKIVEAGAAAPSAMNLRPVRFILLNKSEMAALAEKIEQKTPFLEGQWAVAVCADTRGYSSGMAWLEDSAAAMENMLIAAEELGLGSLWYGVYARPAKEPQLREFLRLPRGVEIAGVAVIGRKGEEKGERGAFDPSVLRFGSWTE
ncbi:MAG: nitroreductase family protein [Synergistaceae bacterium]|nr:nitroreductase family protein [Synergistaceae bacterium]